MAKLFLFLSGEHEDLPVSEVRAILEAEDHSYRVTEKLDQVLRLEADPACVEDLKRRAAFTRLCALELFTCSSETSSIIKAAQSVRLEEALEPGESFVVQPAAPGRT